MRRAAIAVLLAACSSDGGSSDPCANTTDRCCGGGCDAAAPIDVEGDVTLHQTATSQSCPTPVARDPLVLTVVDGVDKTFTATPPVIVSDSGMSEDVDYVNAWADLTDTWGSDTIALSYRVSLARDGTITGTATGTYGGGACRLLVAIQGTYNGP